MFVNGVNKDVAVRRFQEFLLPVWMQPAKRPEGEIGSPATTLLASSKNGEKTPTDLQKYCTLLNVSEISIFHNLIILSYFIPGGVHHFTL